MKFRHIEVTKGGTDDPSLDRIYYNVPHLTGFGKNTIVTTDARP